MATISAVPRTEIQYKGQFFMEMLYKVMWQWCENHGYKDIEGAGNKVEHFYFENIMPGGGAKEVWFWWRVQKQESKYFRYQINIETHILGMNDAETIVDGRKVKTNNLEVSVFITSNLHIDEKDMDIRKHWLTSIFDATFKGRLHKKQIEDKKNELYGHTHALINTIKQHLGLPQHAPQPRPFHDAMGVPQLR
ncbi:MAG: hypothetical protein ACOCWQ_03980 [Nanoarchaeota archaeon]